MAKWLVSLGALNGFLAVALGAFAAHGLKGKITADLLANFETGARYHMYGALPLLAVGLMSISHPSSTLGASGVAFALGIALFSGSLYVMAFTGIKTLGAVTPLGGLSLLTGFALLAWSAWRDLG